METIDITPTWSGILPVLLLTLAQGTDKGKKIATEELQRMARLADNYVALKEGEK